MFKFARSFRLPVLRQRLYSMDNPSDSVESAIREKLIKEFQPAYILVRNDSWQHRNHAAMQEQGNKNGETHFYVEIISHMFENKKSLQRHRMVHNALLDFFAQGLHALSLNTKTETEISKNSETQMSTNNN